jgi:hypothetical protein
LRFPVRRGIAGRRNIGTAGATRTGNLANGVQERDATAGRPAARHMLSRYPEAAPVVTATLSVSRLAVRKIGLTEENIWFMEYRRYRGLVAMPGVKILCTDLISLRENFDDFTTLVLVRRPDCCREGMTSVLRPRSDIWHDFLDGSAGDRRRNIVTDK